MKLEFKHLAPYLSYGLKAINKDDRQITITGCLDKHTVVVINKGEFKGYDLKYIKPILRPICSMDLEEVKELQSVVEDEDVYIAVSNTDIWIEENASDPFSGHMELHVDVLYAAYEWLFKNHFDIFGLINKGLAVEKTL